MAQNPSAVKRQKELARLEWQAEKAAKRKQRQAEKRREKEKEPTQPAPSVQQTT